MRKLIISISFLALLAYQPAIAQTNTATAPVISGVTVSSITSVSAVISWTTDIAATSYVDFGLTDVYGNTLGNGTPVTAHSVTLLGLVAGTQYHFRVRSMESVSNLESKSTDTTLTTATNIANTNVTSNTNAAANANSALNTNLNSNTNKNTNTAKNTNVVANKNVNVNKNTNANRNVNSNTNTGTDIFNQNVNADSESVTGTLDNTNTDLTNVNAATAATASDGRAGIALITLGVLLLVGIIVFAWWKARKPPVVKP